MYTETSKRQQCSPCKNPHPKCFKLSNFDRFFLLDAIVPQGYNDGITSFQEFHLKTGCCTSCIIQFQLKLVTHCYCLTNSKKSTSRFGKQFCSQLGLGYG